MANENFNLYKDFKKIDTEKLAKSAGSTKWPKGKRYTVKLNGKEFKIQTYLAKAADSIPSYGYDAYEAIESIYVRELRPDEIRWETDGQPQYADPEFNTKELKELDSEELKKRVDFIVAVANLINNQETMEAIVAAATKKKNGTFYKGRVVKIASSGIACGGDRVYAIVAKAKNDLTMSVLFDDVLCRSGDNEVWANDFVSTYHDGLIVSEAMKAALE